MQKSQENICAGVSILTKLQAWGLINFKIPFFTEHLWATACISSMKLIFNSSRIAWNTDFVAAFLMPFVLLWA